MHSCKSERSHIFVILSHLIYQMHAVRFFLCGADDAYHGYINFSRSFITNWFVYCSQAMHEPSRNTQRVRDAWSWEQERWTQPMRWNSWNFEGATLKSDFLHPIPPPFFSLPFLFSSSSLFPSHFPYFSPFLMVHRSCTSMTLFDVFDVITLNCVCVWHEYHSSRWYL